MSKVGGERNFGYGKKMDWAGKNALADRYGDGHYATRVAHIERWRRFVSYAKAEGIKDARGVTRKLINLNQMTTPIGSRLSPDQTVTITDPRHPLCGRTLSLIDISNKPYLGRCCIASLRQDVERLVPVQATDLEFDPNDISPSPLSIAAVEHLLRVISDLQQAITGDHSDVVTLGTGGSFTRQPRCDSPRSALGTASTQPATAATTGTHHRCSAPACQPAQPTPSRGPTR